MCKQQLLPDNLTPRINIDTEDMLASVVCVSLAGLAGFIIWCALDVFHTLVG